MVELIAYLAKGASDDPKHHTVRHALLTVAVFYASMLSVGLVFERVLHDALGGLPELPATAAAATAAFLGTYWVALIATRLALEADRRVLVMYDAIWSCTATCLLGAVAAVLRRPALLCACGILVAISQVLWYVDILGYLVTGKLPIKVCAYLFWPTTHWSRRVTGMHHLFFEPLVVLVCASGSGVPLLRGFLISVAQSVVCALVCRGMTPCEVEQGRENEGRYYLNLNLCYELFRGVKIQWLRRYETTEPIVYLPRMLVCWIVGNFVCFAFLSALMLLSLNVVSHWPGAHFVL